MDDGRPSGRPLRDGERFGTLTVHGWDPDRRKYVLWCDCGGTCRATASELRAGRRRTCGDRTAHRSQGGESNMSGDRLHRLWRRLLHEPKGIEERWLSFDSFRDDAYRHGYSDDARLARLDPGSRWSRSNTVWTTGPTTKGAVESVSREGAVRRYRCMAEAVETLREEGRSCAAASGISRAIKRGTTAYGLAWRWATGEPVKGRKSSVGVVRIGPEDAIGPRNAPTVEAIAAQAEAFKAWRERRRKDPTAKPPTGCPERFADDALRALNTLGI